MAFDKMKGLRPSSFFLFIAFCFFASADSWSRCPLVATAHEEEWIPQNPKSKLASLGRFAAAVASKTKNLTMSTATGLKDAGKFSGQWLLGKKSVREIPKLPNESGHVTWTVRSEKNEQGEDVQECSLLIDYRAAFFDGKLGYIRPPSVRIFFDLAGHSLIHSVEHEPTFRTSGNFFLLRYPFNEKETLKESIPVPSNCIADETSAFEVTPVYSDNNESTKVMRGSAAASATVKLRYIRGFQPAKEVDYSSMSKISLKNLGKWPQKRKWYPQNALCTFHMIVEKVDDQQEGSETESTPNVEVHSSKRRLRLLDDKGAIESPIPLHCLYENPEYTIYASRQLEDYEEVAWNMPEDNRPYTLITVVMEGRNPPNTIKEIAYGAQLKLEEVVGVDDAFQQLWGAPAHTVIMSKSEKKKKRERELLEQKLISRHKMERQQLANELKMQEEDREYEQEAIEEEAAKRQKQGNNMFETEEDEEKKDGDDHKM